VDGFIMKSTSCHQCLIYQGSPSGHLATLANILVEKLKSNHRCVYLNSPAMVDEMKSCLCAAGVDVEKETKKGALILTSDQTHLQNNEFDPNRMLDFLRQSVKQAVLDGYKSLWATGDMLWEFGGKIDIDKLFEYEYALEEFFHETSYLSGICQYRRDTVPPEAIRVALTVHQNIWLNKSFILDNPYYMQIRDIHTAEELDGDLEKLVAASTVQASP
jgi:hypothetical protein